MSATAIRFEQKTVLLIEDSEAAMLLVRQALNGQGHGKYRLTWTKSLREGLRELYEGGPDVVVLDLGLVESSGSLTYDWVRDYANDVPIIVLTSEDSQATKNSVLAAGADDFLLKQQFSGRLLLQAIQAVLQKHQTRLPNDAAPAETRQKHILLIEDDEDAMLLVQCTLREHGQGRYRLEWVNSLQAGMDHLAKGGIDIVLLDIGLPDSSGPAGYRKVREAAPDIPVLVLTGSTCIETEFAALSSDADDYLEKTQTSGSGLLQAIRAVLFEARRKRDVKTFADHKAFRRASNTFWGM